AVKNVDGIVSWLGGLPALRESRQDAAFTPTTGFVLIENEIAAFVAGMEFRTLHVNIVVFLTQTKFGLGL
ncbi:MAG TPA: hypothetical protein VLB84_11250, partial [Bacteroidia bacterium]|nr:hypothetical protein [Bacteroidia bacterium]